MPTFTVGKIIQLGSHFERPGPGHVPSQPVNPPENPNYDRNLRQTEIAEIIETIEALPERLAGVDISPPKFVTQALEYLVNELRAKEGEI